MANPLFTVFGQIRLDLRLPLHIYLYVDLLSDSVESISGVLPVFVVVVTNDNSQNPFFIFVFLLRLSSSNRCSVCQNVLMSSVKR